MSPDLMALLVFGFAACLIAAVGLLVRDVFGRTRRQAEERVSGRLGETGVSQLPTIFDEPPARSWLGRLDQRFNRLVAETGLDMEPAGAFLLMILCGLVLGGSLFVWREQILLAIGGMAAGMVVPLVYLVIRRNRRRRAMQEQLPDVLDLLARGVRAGESLDQAIALVGEDSPPPLGIEFRRCARQMEMGLSLQAAMRSLVRRVPLMEARIMASALLVQRASGGNLATTMERLAAVVRDRLSYRRQFRATTAAGRYGATLIALVAPLVLAVMAIWQPEYAANFFSEPFGWILIGTAFVLNLLGVLWVFSMLRTDY
jgi:tight adherence protein B